MVAELEGSVFDGSQYNLGVQEGALFLHLFRNETVRNTVGVAIVLKNQNDVGVAIV